MDAGRLNSRWIEALCLLMLIGATWFASWPDDPTRWTRPLAWGAIHNAPLALVLFLAVGALWLTRPPPLVAALGGALVVGGLLWFWAACAAVPVLVALYVHRSLDETLPPFAVRVGTTSLLAALLLAVGVRASGPPPGPPTADEAARRAFAEGNRQRALWHARQWAAQEGDPPGRAVLFLSRVASSLGDDDVARMFLLRVANEGRDDDVKRDARAQLEAAP